MTIIECIFLEYNHISKGYKVQDVSTKSMITSQNIIFLENSLLIVKHNTLIIALENLIPIDFCPSSITMHFNNSLLQIVDLIANTSSTEFAILTLPLLSKVSPFLTELPTSTKPSSYPFHSDNSVSTIPLPLINSTKQLGPQLASAHSSSTIPLSLHLPQLKVMLSIQIYIYDSLSLLAIIALTPMPIDVIPHLHPHFTPINLLQCYEDRRSSIKVMPNIGHHLRLPRSSYL